MRSKFVLLLPACFIVGFGFIVWLSISSADDQRVHAFSDCSVCPEMVALPLGSFRQGDLQGSGDDDEQPVHDVRLVQRLALARTEVTYRHWDFCVQAGRCEILPEEGGDARNRPDRPVQNVSWNDTQKFIAWLKDVSGEIYRLPSESEFEYAARAGSQTRFAWGDEPSRQHANYGTDECCDGHVEAADKWFNTAPVRSFPANAFGLFDLAGNVQEWVEDCWSDSYEYAPRDGSARVTDADCEFRILRGGSWSSMPRMIRPANRDKGPIEVQLPYYGFRVARDM